MTICLQINHLYKSYRTKNVLSDVSLILNNGEIMGLVGENGSGKTTIFKSVLGLVKKDAGSITVSGQPADGRTKSYLNTVGAMIEYPAFYEQLTALQNLSLTASLYDKPTSGQEDFRQTLKLVGLSGAANDKVSGFSLGMKQR